MKVKRERYDAVLELHALDFRSGLIAGASFARRRIGFPRWRCRDLSYLFTNVKVDLPSAYMNRVDEFTQLIQQVAPGASAVRSPVPLLPQHRSAAEAFWQEHLDVSRPTVLVHCPVNDARKRWPLSRYAELADRLLVEDRVNVLLTWGPGQEDQVKTMLHHMQGVALLAPEFKSLKILAAFIERADLFVGNDTGPMHIANAMGTPVVALFRGSFILNHQPYWHPRRVVYYPLHKQRDLKDNRAEAGNGLSRIDVETVHKACLDMLTHCADKFSRRPTASDGAHTERSIPSDR